MSNYFQNGYLRNEADLVGRSSPLLDALQGRSQNTYATNPLAMLAYTQEEKIFTLEEMLRMKSLQNEQLMARCNLLNTQLQQVTFQLAQLTSAYMECRYSQNTHVTNQVVNITWNQNATPANCPSDSIDGR